MAQDTLCAYRYPTKDICGKPREHRLHEGFAHDHDFEPGASVTTLDSERLRAMLESGEPWDYDDKTSVLDDIERLSALVDDWRRAFYREENRANEALYALHKREQEDKANVTSFPSPSVDRAAMKRDIEMMIGVSAKPAIGGDPRAVEWYKGVKFAGQQMIEALQKLPQRAHKWEGDPKDGYRESCTVCKVKYDGQNGRSECPGETAEHLDGELRLAEYILEHLQDMTWNRRDDPDATAKKFRDLPEDLQAKMLRMSKHLQAEYNRHQDSTFKDALVDCWSFATLVPGFIGCREVSTLVMKLLGDEIGPIYARREQERREEREKGATTE